MRAARGFYCIAARHLQLQILAEYIICIYVQNFAKVRQSVKCRHFFAVDIARNLHIAYSELLRKLSLRHAALFYCFR